MIYEGNIFTPKGTFKPGKVETDGDIITNITYYDDVKEMNNDILPGLVDIHLHGADGSDFCDGTLRAFEDIAAYERDHGIVAFCSATMTLSEEKLSRICKCASRVNLPGYQGIYLEGPFISEKRAGAQKKEYIRKPDIELINKLDKLSEGLIKYILVAPEEADENIVTTFSMNHIVTIGHSDARYGCALKAFNEGASQVTHLYNAMSAFDKRSPGIIGAAYDKNAYVELICDGFHVHPSVINMTFKAYDEDRIILISDSMMATGMEDGEYYLGEQTVYVSDRCATLADGSIAGSVTNLYDCMMNAISYGVPVKKAIKAASANPAKSLGIYDKYGSIEIGKCGRLNIVDKAYRLHHKN